MPRFVLALAFIVSLIFAPFTEAQQATPVSSPLAAGPLLQLELVDIPSDRSMIVSVSRTTYEGGGQQSVVAGSGPMLFFVETGTLTVVLDRATTAPRIVRAGEIGLVASSQDPPSLTLTAGDAVLLSATSSTKFRNDAPHPATMLTLLSANDAKPVSESGVNKTILVQLNASLPPAPLALMLTSATLAPGERFSLPSAPAVTVLAVVERSQAFSLSGSGNFNRGNQPIDIYVLTLSPISAQSAVRNERTRTHHLTSQLGVRWFLTRDHSLPRVFAR